MSFVCERAYDDAKYQSLNRHLQVGMFVNTFTEFWDSEDMLDKFTPIIGCIGYSMPYVPWTWRCCI
jgi:hypothetical protein